MKNSIVKEIESLCLSFKPEDAIQIIEKALKSNLIVKQNAQIHIGKIIASLEDNKLIERLLRYYYAIPTMEYYSNIDKENALVRFIEIFPTVYTKFQNWDESKDSYIAAAYSKFASVRLAACKTLPEVAQLIGKESAAKDLCPILENCISDNDKCIRLCCYKLLSKFFTHIPQKQQTELASYLKSMKVKTLYRKIITRNGDYSIMLRSSYLCLLKAQAKTI